jgi:hypothetical protein
VPHKPEACERWAAHAIICISDWLSRILVLSYETLDMFYNHFQKGKRTISYILLLIAVRVMNSSFFYRTESIVYRLNIILPSGMRIEFSFYSGCVHQWIYQLRLLIWTDEIFHLYVQQWIRWVGWPKCLTPLIHHLQYFHQRNSKAINSKKLYNLYLEYSLNFGEW